MILLISAGQPDLDGQKDDRFGRANWLIRVDTASNQWEALVNPGVNQSGGAGVVAAQFAIDQKADVVISGDFGPHAAQALKAANLEMRLFSSDVRTVRQARDFYLEGKLPVVA